METYTVEDIIKFLDMLNINEAVKAKIEKALEFYEKCEQFQITKEYQLTDALIQNEQCRAHHRVAREDAEDRNKYQPQEEKATIQANSTNSGNGLDSEESQPSESWKNEFIDNCIKDKYLVRPLSSPASIDRYVLLKDISRWIEDAKKSVFSKSDFETIRECLFNCRQATEEAYFDEHRSIIGKIESLLKDKGGQDVK